MQVVCIKFCVLERALQLLLGVFSCPLDVPDHFAMVVVEEAQVGGGVYSTTRDRELKLVMAVCHVEKSEEVISGRSPFSSRQNVTNNK